MFNKTYTIEKWNGDSYYNQDLREFIKKFGAWNFIRNFGTEPDFGLKQVPSWKNIDSGIFLVKGSFDSVFKTTVKHLFVVKNSQGIILDPWMIIVNYHRDVSEVYFLKSTKKWTSTSKSRKHWRQCYRQEKRTVHQILKAKYNVEEDGEPPIRNKCKLYINRWDDDYYRSKPVRCWKHQSKRNKQFKGA